MARAPAGTKLGSVAQIERALIAPYAIDNDTRFVGLENIAPDGTVAGATVAARELRSAKFRFTERHVLYGKLRPYLRKVARPDFAGICSTDILPILPGPDLDRDFLFHFLRQPRVVAVATSRSDGVNLPRLSPKTLLEFPIFLPPLAEQRRIAAMLDKADGVRRKRRESLRLLDEFLRAAFLEMFGDPVRNEKGWEVNALSSMVVDAQYGTSVKANSDRRGLPILRMNNLTASGEIDLADVKWCEVSEGDMTNYTVRRGDILFNRTNSPELVGKTAVWDRDEPFAFAGYLVRVRLNEDRVLPHYLSGFLNSAYGKHILFHTAKPSINMSNISASTLLRVRVPTPSLEAQRRYADVVHRVAATKHRFRAAVEHSASLFDSLAQQAFG